MISEVIMKEGTLITDKKNIERNLEESFYQNVWKLLTELSRK